MTDGDHARRRREAAQRAAEASRGDGRRQAPLRRIVDSVVDDGVFYHDLECGHREPYKGGLYGPAQPKRRRCLTCAELTSAE